MPIIQLTQGYDAIVDEQDYLVLRKIRWCVTINRKTGNRYAVGTINGKQVRMHRYLMQPPANMLIDHIDGNGLNNCRSNLRIASASENLANVGMKKHNTSGYKGVHFTKQRSHLDTPWAAYLGVLKKNRFLGYFETAKIAAKAYDAAAKLALGEFARLNFTD